MPRKVIVFHSYYGCETGCCGHTVTVTDSSGESDSAFDFSHPYDEDPKEFAINLVIQEYGKDHVADLDWEHCIIEEFDH